MNKQAEISFQAEDNDSNTLYPSLIMQQSYLLGRTDTVELGNGATRIYLEVELNHLDPVRFQQAVDKTIARHPPLRTLFHESGHMSFRDHQPYKMIIEDLRGLSEQVRDQRLMQTRVSMEDNVKPLTEMEYLFEVRLSRLTDNQYLAHFDIELIVIDFACLFVLFNDVGRFYGDLDMRLPQFPLHIGHYANQFEVFKQSEEFLEARQYWLDRIDTFPSGPNLPYTARSEWPTKPKMKRLQFDLTAQEWELLCLNGHRDGVSPTVYLMNAFVQLLGFWGGKTHFALNMTILNKLPIMDNVEEISGDFTSTMLVEVNADPEMPFAERAKALGQQMRRDIKHSHFSGMEMLRELSRHRGVIGLREMGVVFTSLLRFKEDFDAVNTWDEHQELSDYHLRYTSVHTSQIAIDHQIYNFRDGTTRILWDVVEEVFPENFVREMFASYEVMIRCLIQDYDKLPAFLPCPIPEKEVNIRKQQNSVTAAISEQLLHQPFEAQAAFRPEQVAVQSKNHQLTYGQLEKWSDALANQLVADGAQTNELIGVVMRKSWQQVVAVMAILKAGAAYMPIDATLPEQRQLQLIEQGGCKILLFQSETQMLPQLNPDIKCHYLPEEYLATLTGGKPPVRQSMEDIAYVIFTSGSTGVPKGVVIDHRGALNTINDLNQRFSVGPDDAILGLSSLSFDLSVYDIFGLLAAGGTLVLPEPDDVRDQDSWLAYVKDFKVTLWNTVPALMQLFAEQCVRRDLSLQQLRVVMMSGDWIPPSLPDQIRALAGPECTIISMGGATEASIWSIIHEIKGSTRHLQRIPYGTAMVNQQFFVLDKHLRPRPNWVVGDLYIGGVGVAMGYWRDAEKTAASFITSPSGERIYRTGDVGRYTPGGIIEILGREDNQVKVQGHRIELGEVETCLQQHPDVDSSIVVVVDDDKHKYLAAYVVTDETQRNSLSDSDKALFILEQRSVRRLDETLPRLMCAPSEGKSSWWQGLNALQQSQAPQNIAEGTPLSKYAYPSASTLYPVQTYVWLSNETGHQGLFYYSPIEGALVRIAELLPDILSGKNNQNQSQLLFVADLDCILPWYSEALSEQLMTLELGYILEVLKSALPDSVQMQLDESFRPHRLNTDSCPEHLLPEHAFWLGTATVNNESSSMRELPVSTVEDLFKRKSYRQFLGDTPSLESIQALIMDCRPGDVGCQVLLYVKSEQNQWWQISSGGQQMLPFDAKEQLGESLYTSNNVPIFNGASFAIFLCADNWLQDELSQQFQLRAGEFGQRLLSIGWKRKIGICPIGALSEEQTSFLSNNNVVHCFLGGGVTAEQINSYLPSELPETENQEPSKTGTMQDSLIAYLEERLPYYMVPRVYVSLPSLPLTATGKIDRKSLPPIDAASQGMEYRAPRNEREKLLANLWQEFLGEQKIGIDENFFTVGGNSLIAMQIVAALKDSTPYKVTLRQLFEKPQIAELAKVLTANNAQETLDQTQQINALTQTYKANHESLGGILEDVYGESAEQAGVAYPLSESQRRLYAHEQIAGQRSAYNIQMEIHLGQETDVAKMQRAVNALLTRHSALRSVIVEIDNQLMQWVPEQLHYELQVVNIMELLDGNKPEAEVIKMLLEEDASKPFDMPGRKPLSRYMLLKTNSDTPDIMVLSAHHIIADYISSTIIQHELAQFYWQQNTPTIAASFHSFVLWQNHISHSDEGKKQLVYWQEKLSDLPVPALPGEKSISDSGSMLGQWYDFELAPALVKQISDSCQVEDFTTFMLGLTALQQVVAFNNGTQDIAIGTPISTRSTSALQEVCGLMLNTLVMRINSSSTTTRKDLLQVTRQVCIEAFENKDLAFELMQTEVQWQYISPSDLPYRVRFVFREMEPKPAPSDAIQLGKIAMDRSDSKFDLLVNLNQTCDRIYGDFEYRETLIDRKIVDILVAQYQLALGWFADPQNVDITDLHKSFTKIKQEKLKKLQKLSTGKRRQSLQKLVKREK